MTSGDLILYQSSGRWYERLITTATHGPYVHVAIVVDTAVVIAADAQGIRYDAIPPIDDSRTLVPIEQWATPAGIAAGLTWAKQQQGREYGWLDIVYQGVKFLWPNNPFRFGEIGHMDCSDFVTRYLQHCGVQLPDSLADPYANTPNDLARFFGLIPQRRVTNNFSQEMRIKR